MNPQFSRFSIPVLFLTCFDTHGTGSKRTLLHANSANSKILIVIGEGNNAVGGMQLFANREAGKSCSRSVLCIAGRRSYFDGGRVRHFGSYLYDLASAT